MANSPQSLSAPLWSPSQEQIEATQMFRFQKLVEQKYSLSFSNYPEFHQWSIDHPGDFWSMVSDYVGIQYSTPAISTLRDEGKFSQAQWFSDSRLNFAENLLCPAELHSKELRDNKTAIISLLENGQRKELSYSQLYQKVECLGKSVV